jgi:hypothetical protein
MISKACIVGSYQKKLEELAKFPDVELTVVVPPYWRDERGVMRLEREHTQEYELVVERMALNGHFHLHFYPGLAKYFRRTKPHIVHIDEEPYNVATWQEARSQSRLLHLAKHPSPLSASLQPHRELQLAKCRLCPRW